MTKICTKCKVKKSISDFHNTRYTWCKKCFNGHAEKWSKTPEGRFSRYQAQTRGRNRRGAIGSNSSVEKQKTRIISFELTFEEFKCYWQKPCFYCGGNVETIGLDRVDNQLGYTKYNVVSCCKTCNWMKRDMAQSDFISHCTKISTKHNNQ